MIRISAIFLALLAAACASSGARPAKSAQTAQGADQLIFTPLPESALPKGKCGMILWTLESDLPAPILRYVAGQKAEIALNGAPAALALSDASGLSDYGVSEHQSFDNGDGQRLEVNVRFGLGFDGGSYLEHGLISLETGDGWRVVSPVAGIAGCRR